MQIGSFLRSCALGALLLACAFMGARAATADGPARAIGAPARAIEVQSTPRMQLSPEVLQRLAMVPVRNFIGKSYREAQAGLAQDSLKPELAWTKSSRPRGEVIVQQPAQGQVPRGSLVRLEASDGSLVVVPELRRQDVAAAQREARARGLELRAEYRESAAPAGLVLQQRPQPGEEVARGTVVSVLAAQPATPPPSVSVPEVVRMDEALARERLAAAGLRASRSERQSDQVPAGAVLMQDPQPGEQVARGTPVRIVVATPVPLVGVPDLVGLPEDAASERLRHAGLRPVRKEEVSDQHAPGVVLAQDPRPRTEVARDSQVTIQVAVAPPPSLVWVPSFVGKQEDAARAALRALDDGGAGPAVTVRSVARHSSAPAQRVLAQQPANARVPRGTVVTLHVSDASMVRVPDVRQVDEAEAVDRLRSEGLQALTRQQRTDRHAPGLVFQQSPRAGQEVARDAQVTVTVAAAMPAPPAPPTPPGTEGPAGSATTPPTGGGPGATPPGGGPGGTPPGAGGPGAPPSAGGPGATPPSAGGPTPTPPTATLGGGSGAANTGAPATAAGPGSRFAVSFDAPWSLLLAAGAAAALLAARALARRAPNPATTPPQPGAAGPQAPQQAVPAADAPKPRVHAEWRGPGGRPALSAPEGAPVRLSVRVSALRSSERPLAVVSRPQEEVSHA